jgi:glycosyltransferase involved in cell wall biosynthesis
MLEPLGQSQVLAYLERLAPSYCIHLISFEKKVDWGRQDERRAIAARIAEAGIFWHPLRYHKRPSAPATAFDIAAGAAKAVQIARRECISVVHARSYVAALMALAAKRFAGARLLFDIRGFWADERVDGGIWPREGRLYRTAKSTEQSLFLAADHVVALTHASAAEISRFSWLRPTPPITVIPTCADLDLFSRRPRPPGPFTLGHVGSLGTWYLLDETLAFFRSILHRIEDARLLVVNRGEHELVRARALAADISLDRLELTEATHREVPNLIARMSAGAALIKPVYSKIASAPTKLAEYLGCGIPCLGNAGVGDMESILEAYKVGVALPGFSRAQMEEGAERLLALTSNPGLSERCAAVARQLFSLEAGVDAYDAVWQRLLTA